jgi:hypothetical protein
MKIVLVLLAIVGFALSLVYAGVTGRLFALWPTSWPDQELQVTASNIAALGQLRAQPKFLEDEKLFYPGATGEATRLAHEALVNALIGDLESNSTRAPRKSYVLARFKAALTAAETWDSEDQDRLALYLVEIMGILGIESSNGLINVWRYGFPYGWLPAY